MDFFFLPNSNKYPDPGWLLGLSRVPGVGAAAWGNAWGRGRLFPKGSLLSLTPNHPHTHSLLPQALLPPCFHMCPNAGGFLCYGWGHLHLQLWGWQDKERAGLCWGEMSKNRPVTEGGWELGQGRAQLLVGICKEEED